MRSVARSTTPATPKKKSPVATKVHAAYTEFQQLLQDWGSLSEGAYR